METGPASLDTSVDSQDGAAGATGTSIAEELLRAIVSDPQSTPDKVII